MSRSVLARFAQSRQQLIVRHALVPLRRDVLLGGHGAVGEPVDGREVDRLGAVETGVETRVIRIREAVYKHVVSHIARV